MRNLFYLSIIWSFLGVSMLFAFDWDQPDREIPLKKPESIRVLWWNIQFGKTNKELKEGGTQAPLDKNLLEMIQGKNAPDIIILGEYEKDSLAPGTEKKIKKLYLYGVDSFWPYNPMTSERGIAVFSKISFKVIKKALLDYYPLELKDKSKIKEYKSYWSKDFSPERFFPRTYLNLRFQKGGKMFSIVPFHALIHVEKEFRESGGGFLSMTWIKLKMIFGKNNPMMYQLKRLRAQVEKDFGSKLSSPFLLIGDFNLPRKIYGMTTAVYSVLSKNLKNLFLNSSKPTWPMPSSAEFQETSIRAQIDHAFCSKTLNCSQSDILPFKGSDHAAIIVDLKI